jgi:hypothetical protein
VPQSELQLAQNQTFREANSIALDSIAAAPRVLNQAVADIELTRAGSGRNPGGTGKLFFFEMRTKKLLRVSVAVVTNNYFYHEKFFLLFSKRSAFFLPWTHPLPAATLRHHRHGASQGAGD